MTSNKQLVINMMASFIAYLVSFSISLFISPYIVRTVGVEAYGFVGLANNFISYANLITVALNSMAGRFITIKIHEKDTEGANKYFTSVLFANIVICLVLFVIFGFSTIYLEHIINIPLELYSDVKLLFLALFLNCLLSTIGTTFSIATFATNKLYLDSIRKIESNLLRVVIILLLFVFFVPKVSYIGITAFVCGIYVFVFNVHYTKKLLPQIRVKLSCFDIKAIIEVVFSGVWNLINRLGQLLLDGLDLLITNLFISSTAMGVLSLAKTLPNIIIGIVSNLVVTFSPNFTMLYAQNKKEELLKSIKQAMKIMGIIVNIPVIILIVCGDLFFALWQPTQNATQLQILSVITCGAIIFSGGINCIYNIFTVANKLKLNSLVVIASGIVSTISVFLLLKFTDLGIYAVAGTSTLISILRNVIFTAPYGAYCMKQKWYAFYPAIIRPIVYVLLSCLLGVYIKSLTSFDGWIGFIVSACITGILAIVIGLFIMLDKNDRKIIFSKLRK